MPRERFGKCPGYKPVPISKVEVCFRNIEFLSNHIAVYPQPGQLLFRGQKTNLLGQLVEIALEITKTPFPEFYILENPLEEKYVNNESVVIKRGVQRVWASCVLATEYMS